MRDVAAVAGVSLSTVSRAINGDVRVSAALAQRIDDAVRVLGYRHNLTASTLRRADGLSATIGLIFEDVSNPFFSAIHRGVEEVARERGVLTFSGSSDEDEARERALAEAFAARGVDGLIIVPTAGDHGYLGRDRSLGLALAFVDRPPPRFEADTVTSDNDGGARAGVEHLIRAGHRRIGFLGDRPEIFTAAERLAGYRAALRGAGIAEDPRLVEHPTSHAANAHECTVRLLSGPEPPTALFTSQNLITAEALRAVHRLGLQERVAIVGFDDVTLADVVRPGLTVVAQDPLALGRSAAEALFSRLDGHEGPARRIVIPTPLIQRGSGEIPPPHQTP